MNKSWIDLPYNKCGVSNDRYNELFTLIKKKYDSSSLKYKSPIAVLMTGNPGVGKSTIRWHVDDEYFLGKNRVLCDPDDIIENVQEYKDGLNLKDINGKQTNVGSTNAWSNCINLGLDLMRDLIVHSANSNKNLLIDYPSSYEYIPFLKKTGYKIILVYVHAEGFLRRRFYRAMSTGRFMDGYSLEQIQKMEEKPTTIDTWSDFLGLWADEYIVYNNSEKRDKKSKINIEPKKYTRKQWADYIEKMYYK